MEARNLRLFFGLPLPPDPRGLLGAWQEGQAGIDGWSRPEGLHLTLAFLGPRSPEALPGLETLAAGVAARHRPMPLGTTGLGSFSGGPATRLLWLGLAPSPALEALAADLRRALLAAGEAMDAKPFHPHLTLARFRRPHPLSGFADPPTLRFTADRLVLFESRPQGRYTPLRTWVLRAV